MVHPPRFVARALLNSLLTTLHRAGPLALKRSAISEAVAKVKGTCHTDNLHEFTSFPIKSHRITIKSHPEREPWSTPQSSGRNDLHTLDGDGSKGHYNMYIHTYVCVYIYMSMYVHIYICKYI